MVDEEKIEPTPVEVKPVEEEKVEPTPVEGETFPTKILVAFILAVIGSGFALNWNFTAIFAVPLGIVALCLNKNQKTERQPFKAFAKATNIAGKIEIPVGAVMFFAWLITQIVQSLTA